MSPKKTTKRKRVEKRAVVGRGNKRVKGQYQKRRGEDHVKDEEDKVSHVLRITSPRGCCQQS
jgi:hypothetical protein